MCYFPEFPEFPDKAYKKLLSDISEAVADVQKKHVYLEKQEVKQTNASEQA